MSKHSVGETDLPLKILISLPHLLILKKFYHPQDQFDFLVGAGLLGANPPGKDINPLLGKYVAPAGVSVLGSRPKSSRLFFCVVAATVHWATRSFPTT